jgi:hypothetical protein
MVVVNITNNSMKMYYVLKTIALRAFKGYICNIKMTEILLPLQRFS